MLHNAAVLQCTSPGTDKNKRTLTHLTCTVVSNKESVYVAQQHIWRQNESYGASNYIYIYTVYQSSTNRLPSCRAPGTIEAVSFPQ